MVHRLALFIGGVAAAGILALAMGLGGLQSASPVAADAGAQIDGGITAVAPTPDATRTVIDKVYVEPTPEPAVVHVNRPPSTTARASTANPPHGGERERGDRGERGEPGDD